MCNSNDFIDKLIEVTNFEARKSSSNGESLVRNNNNRRNTIVGETEINHIRRFTESHKKGISVALKGIKRPNISERNRNKVWTEEEKRKISESLKKINRENPRIFSNGKKKEISEKIIAAKSKAFKTPNGIFATVKELIARLEADGIKAPKFRLSQWRKAYPNDFHYCDADGKKISARKAKPTPE